MQKAAGLHSKYWNLASSSEKAYLMRHPNQFASWTLICKRQAHLTALQSKPQLTTRSMVQMMMQEERRAAEKAASLVIDATRDDEKEARITKDTQFGLPYDDVVKRYQIVDNTHQQDGFNCLYIALRSFAAFQEYSISELRDQAASTIEERRRLRGKRSRTGT